MERYRLSGVREKLCCGSAEGFCSVQAISCDDNLCDGSFALERTTFASGYVWLVFVVGDFFLPLLSDREIQNLSGWNC